jgi:hypothetical protein
MRRWGRRWGGAGLQTRGMQAGGARVWSAWRATGQAGGDDIGRSRANGEEVEVKIRKIG